MARFTNGDQTVVQLMQIKSDLQFDRQIKLKSFNQHICGSDQLTPLWPEIKKTRALIGWGKWR